MNQLAALGGDTGVQLLEAWQALSLPLQLVVGGALGVPLLVALYFISRKIARRARKGRQRFFVVMTIVSTVLALALGVWAYLLPEPERVSFVLSHQIVRVGAALFGTLSMLAVLALSLPWALDRLERQSFVSFVAARHVRADKSGFLTVISILSIAGVAISSFALCAVVSTVAVCG